MLIKGVPEVFIRTFLTPNYMFNLHQLKSCKPWEDLMWLGTL